MKSPYLEQQLQLEPLPYLILKSLQLNVSSSYSGMCIIDRDSNVQMFPKNQNYYNLILEFF